MHFEFFENCFSNAGIEAAMNWVFEHSQDPDFAAPFEVISSKGSGKSEAKYEDISQIVSLGFNEIQARNALLKFVSYLSLLFLNIYLAGVSLN